VFANEIDFQGQFDARAAKVTARQHRTIRAQPCDRLIEELKLMAPLPETVPDTDRRWVLRIAPDPYVRFDSCDYSLDPDLVGDASRFAAAIARSPRSRWTPASWPAATPAHLLGIARPRPWSTPAR
jgi:hypothetical protein